MAKKNYNDWSKEDLIKEVEALRKQKTYGLLWEKDKTKEIFDYYINWDGIKNEEKFPEAEHKLPVLKEVKDKDITTDKDKDYNLLIEGDNYHALAVLNFTHNKAIDVCYIDPPYNRGGDFRYNDDYVDSDDPYKHSKWLSFMEKRLKLAKEVLTNNGVMFISIDDTEFAQLKIICDEIFGEDNVGVIVWRKSGDGRDGKMKNTTTYRIDHEYIIVCFKSKKYLNKLKEIPNFKGDLENPDNDPRGLWLSGSISRKEEASNPNHQNYYEVISPTGKKHKRQWDMPKDEFNKLHKENRIYWGSSGNNVPRIKIFESEEREITPYSILLNHGTTTEGTKEVNTILNGDFSEMRPKPSSLIQTLIQIASKKDSLVLDFFAGTGTTVHSVLKLNKKDKGNRKIIACTNNEKNICSDVCYPRIKKVIEGYKSLDGEKIGGISGNLKYFRTDFVESAPTDKNKKKIVDKSTEMICIKENAFISVKEKKEWKIFKNHNYYLGIIFDEDYIEDFVKEAKKLDKKIHVYVFSLDESVPEKEFKELKNKAKLCPIPEVILHVYRRIFK